MNIFNPGDKIVLESKPPYNYITPYIVTGYTETTQIYYVVSPNKSNYKAYSKFDLENRFRLANELEIELYFE